MTISHRPAACWFGDMVAARLVVEPGTVVVGKLQVGSRPAKRPA